MQWIPFPDPRLPVFGLPWFSETTPELWRLPPRLKGVVRDPVWNLSLSPSGGRIRFGSDTRTLGIRLHYATHGRMHNMCTIGQMGVDLYEGRHYWKSAFPTQAGDLEYVYFDGLEKRPRDFTLYLPLYHPVRVTSIGIDDDARLEPPARFAVPKPVAFYGTSITQGGCSSRGGLSYQAILCRELNLDFVNLGFSGNGRGEAEMARTFADVEASCYVCDFARNNGSAESLREVYEPFLGHLRVRRPDTPIVCVTPVWDSSERYDPRSRDRIEAMRRVIREAVESRKMNHDRRITLVEGKDLLGPDDGEGLVDGVHPNDLGFQAMADGLRPVLKRVLRLD